MSDLEVITMGRVSVDLYPEQIGVPPAEVNPFAKSLGGSATNVAVAAARLGHRSAVVTKVGNDGFGPYVRTALEGFGVDARYVGTDPDLRTPLAFCEIHPPDDFPLLFYTEANAPHRTIGDAPDLRPPLAFCEIPPPDDFPLLFYREPKAPDSNIGVEDLDLGEISSAPLFWITGTGLSEEPSRSTTLGALEARSGGITVVDLDYRPMLWNSREETERWYHEALKNATVAVGNQEEVEVAVGT